MENSTNKNNLSYLIPSFVNFAKIKNKFSCLPRLPCPSFSCDELKQFLIFFVVLSFCGSFCGSMIFLIVRGSNGIEESKRLVMTVNATVVNNSISHQTCDERAKGRIIIVSKCYTTYTTQIYYTFNDQIKNLMYNSSDQYFANDTIYISISKKSGNMMSCMETKQYDKSFEYQTGGIVGLVALPFFCILLCYCYRDYLER